MEGRLIPPALLIQEYFPTEKKEIEELEAKLETIANEKNELQEEHGGEEAALQGVSTKKDADNALTDYVIQAMEEYYAEDFKKYSFLEQEIAKCEAYLKKENTNEFIEALKNLKGKLTQKALTDKAKSTGNTDEKRVLDKYVETLKKSSKAHKELNDVVDAVTKKLDANIKASPEADYIKEIIIIQKYLGLLESETESKAKLKKALEELEKKVIAQYPKLSIDEIKTIVVEKKWMANMEQRIRTEMDNISHRLTQRIKELADRYETPLPTIANNVSSITGKVQSHLQQMKQMQDLMKPKDDWKWVTMEQLGKPYGGLSGKSKSDFSGGNCPYIPFMNVMSNPIVDTNYFDYVKIGAAESQHKAAKGDLFFNGSSETPEEVGMCSVLLEDIPNLYLNSFCFGFRLFKEEKNDGLYLAYFFRSSYGRKLFYSLAQGATRHNLSKSNFLKIEFQIPSPDEQVKIAGIVKDMYDEISALEKQLEKYNMLKQGIMQG